MSGVFQILARLSRMRTRRSKTSKTAASTRRRRTAAPPEPFGPMKPTVSRAQVTAAQKILAESFAIEAKPANVRGFLSLTGNEKPSEIPTRVASIKQKYNATVSKSLASLRNATRLNTITRSHQKAYAANYIPGIRRALSYRAATPLGTAMGATKKTVNALLKKGPQAGSFLMDYVYQNFLADRNIKPLLTYKGKPSEIFVNPEHAFYVEGYYDEDSGELDEYTGETREAILKFLAAQVNNPTFYEFTYMNDNNNDNNDVEKDYYLANGTLYLTAPHGFTSPLTRHVKLHYGSTERLRDVPLFFVFQTPKSLSKDSHVSLAVLADAKLYSLGFGYKEGQGAFYNLDYVVNFVGEDARGLAFHNRLIDYGYFTRTHLQRILEFVEPSQYLNPVEATFGDGNEGPKGTWGLSTQYIKINTNYKTLVSAQCPTRGLPAAMNCSSFLQYIFYERIQCSMLGTSAFVSPDSCKRRAHPITAERLEEFIRMYRGGKPPSAALYEEMTFGASR